MALAGVHHITISPGLLTELAATEASGLNVESLFGGTGSSDEGKGEALRAWKDDEAGFRLAFTRCGNGEGVRKLAQVITCYIELCRLNEDVMLIVVAGYQYLL